MKEVLDLLGKLQSGELTHEQVVEQVNGLNYIPYSRFKDKVDEVKELNNEIQNRDSQIKQLETAVKGNEELENQIKNLQTENEEWSKKYDGLKLDTAIRTGVKDAKNVDTVLRLLDREGLALDANGQVTGLEDKIKALKESDPYLFKEEDPKEPDTPKLGGRTPNTPPPTQPQGFKNPFSKEHFNLTEQARLFKEEPELYKQLKAQA